MFQKITLPLTMIMLFTIGSLCYSEPLQDPNIIIRVIGDGGPVQGAIVFAKLFVPGKKEGCQNNFINIGTTNAQGEIFVEGRMSEGFYGSLLRNCYTSCGNDEISVPFNGNGATGETGVSVKISAKRYRAYQGQQIFQAATNSDYGYLYGPDLVVNVLLDKNQ